MPEIAEVRTVGKTLNNIIVNHTILDIKTPYKGIIKDDVDYFKKIVIGKKIRYVTNFGKWIYINLGEYTILSHLRMEGKYFIKNRDEIYDRHEHIIFELDNNIDLRYHDTRKFGVMKVVKTEDINNCKDISKLGIEPDSDKLTKEYIYNKIHNKNIPIKSVLLDQSIINGLGNIYVDEVLYASKINPKRLSSNISIKECDYIRENARRIITKATSLGGSTIRSYTSSLGVKGNYQNYLLVHTKSGTPCKVCGEKIIKIKVGGRGTYYCPKCQK